MASNPLTALIVDDEPHAIANLQHLIRVYCGNIQVLDVANNAETAIRKINEHKPDIVFLDVNMPGKDGFSILNKLTHKPFLVFVSAYQEYALRALKISAVDFLLKPIDIRELIATENKLLQLHQLKSEIRESYHQVLNNLFNMLDQPGKVKTISLYSNNRYEIVPLSEVIYLSGMDNYTRFRIHQKKDIVITKTLKEYEDMLEETGFMRIHKSNLVNMSHVKRVISGTQLQVEMSNGESLSVSRRKVKDIRDWMKQGHA